MEDKPKIFISYSRKDKDFVAKLAKDLKDSGISIWLDIWKINIGDSFRKKIYEEGISKSDYLLIVLSKDSIKSNWVKDELNAGLVKEMSKKKIFVLPVVLNIPNSKIPLSIADKKHANFRENYSDGLLELLKTLKPAQFKVVIKGKWTGDSGCMELRQKDNIVEGEYCYNSKEFVGQIKGEVITENVMIFNWKWFLTPQTKGNGYFFITADNNNLIGGWWLSNLDKYIDKRRIYQSLKYQEQILNDLRYFNRNLIYKLEDERLIRKIVNDFRFQKVDTLKRRGQEMESDLIVDI